MKSVNNKIVCKYRNIDKNIKMKGQSTGFAQIQQKNTLIAFEVLYPYNGLFTLNPGDMIYVAEEEIFINQNLQKPMECDIIKEPFILVNENSVILVK